MLANFDCPYRRTENVEAIGVLSSAKEMPEDGANMWPRLLRLITLTSAPGSSAVFKSVGRRSLVNRACPTWFVPN